MKTKFFTLLFAIGASIGTIFGSNTQVDGIWYNFNSSTLTAEVTYRGVREYSYSNEYSGSVVIPSAVTYNNKKYKVTGIGDYAFYFCYNMTSIEIPNSITSIGSNAFESCSGLTSIAIPNNVKNIGDYAFLDCSGLTSVTIPNSVTSIGNYAFRDCRRMASVTIPNSVTNIGVGAFGSCSNLTSFVVADNNPSYCSVDGVLFNKDKSELIQFPARKTISSYIIPNSVTSIGNYAFYSCNRLTFIEIPNGVTVIGNNAFAYCTGLTSIELPNNVTSIGDGAFYYCYGLTSIEIPNSVTDIGRSAFYECNNLTSIKIPSSVTSIGYMAFYKCKALVSVHINDIAAWCAISFGDDVTSNPLTFAHDLYLNEELITELVVPDGVTSIGDWAFCHCSSLTSIVLPNSLTEIGYYAFGNCASLTSIELPNSVTSIADGAFSQCGKLTFINIPNNVTNIGEDTFSYCTNLTSVIIPSSVTSIGNSAFAHCYSLSSIEIPNSVTSISSYAFQLVPNLVYSGTATGSPWGAKSINGYVDDYLVYNSDAKTELLACSASATGEIVIPSSVISIGEDSFWGCSGLTSVTIPSSVSNIGYSAFYGCSSLNAITNLAETPQAIDNVFDWAIKSTCTLYVPKNSVDLYKTTNGWKDFEHIEPIVQYYTVQFLDWDNSVLSSEQVEEESAATPPDNPTREGYTFIGWDRDFSNITEDMTVTAQYSINHYQVDFLDWNGTLLKSDDVEYVSAATPPADPSRDWYTFVGWDKDFSNITSDLVVTAQYEEGQTRDNMIFFINGTDNSEISHQAIEIDFPTPPTIAGFTFLKWQFMAGEIEDGIQIRAVYTYDGEPTSAPSIVANPSNPAQKLIRNGNIYILSGDKTYTVTGEEVR